jgi:hypothetical protein
MAWLIAMMALNWFALGGGRRNAGRFQAGSLNPSSPFVSAG